MKKRYIEFLTKKTSAYDLLEYLQKQTDFTINLPIDIKEIIKYLNINYNTKPNFLKIKLDGMISIENNEPTIWSNPMKTSIKERVRFTLAHELGHFMLHIAPVKDLSTVEAIEDEEISYYRDDNWNKIEMEANTFASQLLMPSIMITEEATKIVTEYPNFTKAEIIEELSKIFAVSTTAMTYRLKSMGVNL